ncbi:MAG: HEAT repeat domain-containing protein, partial [Tepidisphaeraceae bacterium]
MLRVETILSLVQLMPDIDAPPPVRPAPPLPPGEKPKQEPQHWKGKLTGPNWADAQKIYDTLLAAGQEGVATVIDLIKTPDTAPEHKPRYVLNGLATYVCRPGMEKQRATVNAAIVSRLADAKPKMMRANLARILQVCGDASVLPALATMLLDPELCDPAAQVMVSIGPAASEHLRKALATATARPRLAIVQALGGLRDGAATDALLQAAADPDTDVRLAAVWSLSRAGAVAAVDVVSKATDAPENWPRTQATRAAFVLADTL